MENDESSLTMLKKVLFSVLSKSFAQINFINCFHWLVEKVVLPSLLLFWLGPWLLILF